MELRVPDKMAANSKLSLQYYSICICITVILGGARKREFALQCGTRRSWRWSFSRKNRRAANLFLKHLSYLTQQFLCGADSRVCCNYTFFANRRMFKVSCWQMVSLMCNICLACTLVEFNLIMYLASKYCHNIIFYMCRQYWFLV
jgi:hypothetical protein